MNTNESSGFLKCKELLTSSPITIKLVSYVNVKHSDLSHKHIYVCAGGHCILNDRLLGLLSSL
jgi:hypothetical protein